ncbi:hypothetical protein [Oscillatoria sp. HE19RPO]|uniref:hypothetical protein n=1 Tax=Oscillatoria sp. HE19RPO TaxID=2954806 RepID=UPI0020C43F7B|nr:hypothetical protein [Oscillatoria sp. HE19RPO]
MTHQEGGGDRLRPPTEQFGLRELQKIKPSKNPQAQAWGYTDKAVPARAKRALLGAIASKQG